VVWPDGEESEALLAIYKKHLEHLFPFAVVPPHMTSYELRQKKPFFWKAAMVEANRNDGPRQIELGNALLKDISEAAILKPQKSLDLFQGLQVLISWWVPSSVWAGGEAELTSWVRALGITTTSTASR